jgi:hypothetical protein
MKSSIKGHFLSIKDNTRFALFVCSAFLLLGLGMVNKSKSFPFLLDEKFKQMESPSGQKQAMQISESNKA